MSNFLLLSLLGTIFFGLAFAGMAISLIIRGRKMRGGCANHAPPPSKDQSIHPTCEFCSEKQKINLCTTKDKTGLAKISKLSTLGKFDSEI